VNDCTSLDEGVDVYDWPMYVGSTNGRVEDLKAVKNGHKTNAHAI
jgi:hypothetical protein